MPELLKTDIDDFRAMFSGVLFAPDDAGYDEARSLWNGQVDKRPALIARCAHPKDVSAAIGFGRQQGLEISVRGGAHNFSGAAAAEAGLMIDLSALRQVHVDPATKTAVCGGGATWADVDAATQAHGLAVPGGVISHTGIGGLTLGGGMGWLVNHLGLTVDNLLEVQIVTADGQIRRAAADENADLYWAVRGGGGNFGVVTAFTYQLHEVGPLVNLGFFFWDQEKATEALQLSRETLNNLPGRAGGILAAGMNAPPVPFVPAEHHFKLGYALIVVGYGSAEEHAEMVAPIRDALPPLFEFVTPIPFTELQRMLDESAPWGIHAYEKSLYLPELTDEAIAVIAEEVPKKSSPLSFLPIFRLGGAFCEVDADDTAFGGGREPRFVLSVNAVVPAPEMYEAERDWSRAFWERLRPYAADAGSYVNFMVEVDDDRVKAAYGTEKYQKLAAIKATYDPENVFHHNANIKPA